MGFQYYSNKNMSAKGQQCIFHFTEPTEARLSGVDVSRIYATMLMTSGSLEPGISELTR
jgi:hypothetical protein